MPSSARQADTVANTAAVDLLLSDEQMSTERQHAGVCRRRQPTSARAHHTHIHTRAHACNERERGREGGESAEQRRVRTSAAIWATTRNRTSPAACNIQTKNHPCRCEGSVFSFTSSASRSHFTVVSRTYAQQLRLHHEGPCRSTLALVACGGCDVGALDIRVRCVDRCTCIRVCGCGVVVWTGDPQGRVGNSRQAHARN